MLRQCPITSNPLDTTEYSDAVLESFYKSSNSRFIVLEKISNHRGFCTTLSSGSIFLNYSEISALSPNEQTIAYLGTLRGTPIFTFLNQGETNREFADLTTILTIFSDEDQSLVSQAICVVSFLASHSFCSNCGKALCHKLYHKYVTCSPCKIQLYPDYHPCVIFIIQDEAGERMLLTHRKDRVEMPQKSDLIPKIWTHVAGFVDSGETFEKAIARESVEEANIVIDESTLQYISSQPWPHTNSLMFAAMVTASDDSKMKPDGDELDEIRWVSKDLLKEAIEARKNDGEIVDPEDPRFSFELPPNFTIAAYMIEWWAQQ